MTQNSELLTLVKRCQEILDWDKTGLLVDGELRRVADELAGQSIPEDQRLRLAESKTTREAMREVVRSAASAPAVGREEIARKMAEKHSADALIAYDAGAGLAVEYWTGLVDIALSHLSQSSAYKAGERAGAEAMREKCAAELKQLRSHYDEKCKTTTGGACSYWDTKSEAMYVAIKKISALPLPASSATESDGGVERSQTRSTGNTPGSVPGEEMSSSAASFVRVTEEELTSQARAGVASGPSDFISKIIADQPTDFLGPSDPITTEQLDVAQFGRPLHERPSDPIHQSTARNNSGWTDTDVMMFAGRMRGMGLMKPQGYGQIENEKVAKLLSEFPRTPAPVAADALDLVRLGARAARRSAEATCGNHSESAQEDAMTSAGLSKLDKKMLSAEADAADHIRENIKNTCEDSALGYGAYMLSEDDQRKLALLGVTSDWLYRRRNGTPSRKEVEDPAKPRFPAPPASEG